MSGVANTWVEIGAVRIKAKRSLLDNDVGLSTREIQTLFYLSKGFSTTEVAASMDVSSTTIKTYKTRIFNKFGVSTSLEALIIATAIICGAETKISPTRHLDAT